MKKQYAKITCLICVSVLLLPLMISPGVVSAGGTDKTYSSESSTIRNSAPTTFPSSMGPIAAGAFHSCAMTTTGGVECWGTALLGNNSPFGSLIPVNVSGLSSGVSAISIRASHTCALTTTGGVMCWGDNWQGQLGNNSTTSSRIPVNVVGLTSDVSAIAAGIYHTCALTTTGGVKCWGDNLYGALGNDSTTDSPVPVDVVGLPTEVTAISAGFAHTCALTTTGGVMCWGFNTSGQLGVEPITNIPTPVNVTDLSSGVSAISAGNQYTCALTTTGGVKCWGSNWSGMLGNNSTTNSYEPVDVSGLSSEVSAIATSYTHTCALTTTGGVKCWGSNADGQLGNNSTTDGHIPVSVWGLSSGVTAIASGHYHSCAMTTTGGVKCWGRNEDGQLGNNSTTNSLIPVNVVYIDTLKSIAADDGWVLESGENSSVGGTLDSTSTVFNLGDGAADKQYRAVLSFNTASLPDNAVISKVTLKIKKQGGVGSNPFTMLGGLKVDIRKPFFGTTLGLVINDFQAAAGKSAAATFSTTPVSNWYSAVIGSGSYSHINKLGTTQFRLRFATDDNNDNAADYMKFYSGNYSGAASRPALVIEYYVP